MINSNICPVCNADALWFVPPEVGPFGGQSRNDYECQECGHTLRPGDPMIRCWECGRFHKPLLTWNKLSICGGRCKLTLIKAQMASRKAILDAKQIEL